MSIVAIIILLVVVIIGYSMFSDAFKDVAETLAEAQKNQNDQAKPTVQDVGNLAKDTGTRVCNLKVEFVFLYP